MRSWLLLVASSALLCTAGVANADDTCEPGIHCMKAITIYGRPPRPHVVIELVRPTAASAAREAHEAMRAEWDAKLVPPQMRGGG
jgi:hypothetical protein